MPDHALSSLYPVEDNYVNDDAGSTRSPKSLVEICTDTVCRHLADLHGDIPPGIPQDIVDNILKSLVTHSALNATTLKKLRRCELFELPLGGCRGVDDEWLLALNSENTAKSTSYNNLAALHDDAVKWLWAIRVRIVVHYPGHQVTPRWGLTTIQCMKSVSPEDKLRARPCLTPGWCPGTWQGGGGQGQHVGLAQEDMGGQGGAVQGGASSGCGQKKK